MDKVKKKHVNAYSAWTNLEDDKLRKLFKDGYSIPEISKIHKRNTGAIRSRLKKLNLIPESISDE